MLTISDDALAIITKKNQAVYLDMPKVITGCCFDFQECPTVRLGKPHNPADYKQEIIRDVSVYVPNRLPEESMEIGVSSFLGIKTLVLKGWKVI